MEQLLLFLLYAGFFSSAVINKLEKILVQQVWGSHPLTDRPKYRDGLDIGPLLDVPDRYGMPSGHTETTALVCTMLYYYGLIDGGLAFVVTAFMGMHRIMVDRHTPLQVIVGGILGVLYGGLYSYVGARSELVWLLPGGISVLLYTLSRTEIAA